MLNRQQPYGADVITRISATMMDEMALAALRDRAHETLATLTEEVCVEGGVDRSEVYEITVCGNATESGGITIQLRDEKSETADRIRGRIFAFDFAMITLSLAISSLVASALADAIGPRPAVLVSWPHR